MIYRAHNLRWAFVPSSGVGAAKHGGRFNRPGQAALYTSLNVSTAWAEAQQGLPRKVQPLTIVVYECDYDALLDLTDPAIREEAGVPSSDLACDWEHPRHGDLPPSWALVDKLRLHGIGAIRAPSFANGAPTNGANIVFWEWSRTGAKRVQVIDDERRLPKNQSSWK